MFNSEFEIILLYLLLFKIKYRLIHKKQKNSKKNTLIEEKERIKIFNALNEIIKSSKVSITHTRLDYSLLDKLVNLGLDFQDAIICAQLSNSNIDYFVTRDKDIRKLSHIFKFKVTTPKGMLKIINRMNLDLFLGLE